MLTRFLGFSNKRSRIRDDRDTNLVRTRLDEAPRGYPRVAAYLNSDNDTVLFRRFGTLHSRTLLYKQVELTELEAKLEKLDKEHSSEEDNEWKVFNSIHHDDGFQNEERKALVDKIEEKLLAYDRLLLHDEQMRRLSRPSERVHRNFMDYLWTSNQFGEDDKNFIFHEDDFVTLQQYEEGWLDQFLHRVLGHCKNGIWKHLFVSKKDQEKTQDPYIHYYSDYRLGILIKVIIALASTTLLLIPVYLFLTLNTVSIKGLASITLFFAFLFSAALSIFTSAKRHEIFAATAAYCAVLVVFLGNLQQRDWAKNFQPTGG